MKRTLVLSAIALFGALQTFAAEPPRLIVQIVVGSMRAEDLNRYAANFGEGGFRRLTDSGTVYTDCRYDFQQTTTPVALATLSTGAMPSTHGVIGARWIDYTSNRSIGLIDGDRGPGAYQLIAPTLGETLRQHHSESRTATVAAEAMSAVVMAGHGGETYWLEPTRCDWTTSAYYAPAVPEWIDHSNDERYNLSYISTEWRPLLARDRYINSRCNDVVFPEKRGRERQEEPRPERLLEPGSDYERLLYTPAGNTAVLGLAKQLIAQSKLGADRTTDVLNICLDSSRRIAEAYGPESIEVEDMYYRLDRDLADFLTFLFAQVEKGNVTVVLTSDHGTSPSYDMACGETDRFNARQFEVIVNGFLNVRYGTGDWVVAYNDKCVWLNHNRIYERGLNLAEVQNEVAIFAMQFRGVSHALSATAMRSSYFGSGYARRMQNSFYPRRSGDVVLNLMPGWIEEQEHCRSLSGSMYGYDTEVPLVFYGTGAGQQHVGRSVDMTAVAPTLARLAGATQPAASEGEVLPEIVDL